MGRVVRSRISIALVTFVAGVAVASGIAWAAIPSASTGRITVCYPKTGTRTMRLIDYPTQTCTSTENMLSWQANGMRWKGGWLASTAYSANDVVRYNGSTYVAKLANTNVVPTNVTYWVVMALKGDPGTPGPPGAPGAPGAPGPAGPAGPKAVASTSQTIVGGVVNWIPISASFVAAADGSCLVTTSVAPFLTTLPAPPAGQTVAGIGGGVSVNGAPFVTDNTSGLWSTGVGGAYTAPVTVTSYFTIAAGQTYQFGAWYNPHATNGQLATAKQGYVCS